MKNQPKTIHIERSRKINPALISRKFEYMSEDVKFSAWVDVPEDADIEQATADLKEYVNGEIQTEVERITAHYRHVARAQNVYYDEIEPAFLVLMQEMGFGEENYDDDNSKALARFRELLEAEMAKRSV